MHYCVVRQHYCHGPQTPAESGEDCTEDHQDSTALSTEHLPLQSPQESCFHPQRSFPPPARTVYTSTLRTKVQKCEMQDLKIKKLFFPFCHQTPKQSIGACNEGHNCVILLPYLKLHYLIFIAFIKNCTISTLTLLPHFLCDIVFIV